LIKNDTAKCFLTSVLNVESIVANFKTLACHFCISDHKQKEDQKASRTCQSWTRSYRYATIPLF